MDTRQKKAILKYITENDPKGALVAALEPALDFEGGTIRYNSKRVHCHRAVTRLTDEEYARAYLLVHLVRDHGYQPEALELEAEYSIGRPAAKSARIDVIVRDTRADSATRRNLRPCFLFIEVKAPLKYEQDKKYIRGQLFDLAKQEGTAFLGYYSVGYRDGALSDKLLLVDSVQFPSHAAWEAAGYSSLDVFPTLYGQAIRSTYACITEAKGDLRPLDDAVTRDEFAGLRSELHDVVWGGGGTNNNAVFIHLVKLFLTKIYDEQTTPKGEPYQFQRRLHDGIPESPEDLFVRMEALYRQAQKEYLGYSAKRIEQSVGFDRDAVSPQKVAHVVERLQSLSLTHNVHRKGEDVLGEFFETIASTEFTQTKGQFFTHSNIVRFCLSAAGLDQLAVSLARGDENRAKPRLPFCCDPACGSGTFLIEAMKFVTDAINRAGLRSSGSSRTISFVQQALPEAQPNAWAREFIYGIENNADLGLATKVNMVLHGDGNINIFVGDGLLPFGDYAETGRVHALAAATQPANHPYDRPINEQFDFVVSNPPFSIKFDKDTERKLPETFVYAEQRASENLFIERWYQLLREGGRLAAILPDSVFDTSENLTIRLFLYRFFRIRAVISLPYLTFQPFTSTKTSVLIAEKRSRKETEDWDAAMRAARNEFARLKRDATSTAAGKGAQAAAAIARLLGDALRREDRHFTATELRAKYSDSLKEVVDSPDWWAFREVTSEGPFDHPIFMAEATEVGYKRGKRKEKARPNELFKPDARGWPAPDLTRPETILDRWLATRPWDSPARGRS